MTYQMHIIRERNEYSIQHESNWKVDHGYKGYAFAVKREDNSIVCNFPDGLRPEQKQLAQFISAAPDLLAALEMIVGDARNNLVKEHFFIALNAIVAAKEGK